MVVYVVINILLTPLGGFPTRPATNARETSWGLIAIILLLVGAVLGLVSLVFIFSRPLRAAILGIVGAGLYYPAYLADGTGPYSTQSPSAYIASLMTAQTIVALVVIFLATLYLPPRRERTGLPESK